MKTKLFAGLALLTALVGCATAPQAPLPLAPAVLSASSGKMGVLFLLPAKPDTYFPGADCLLCIGVANVAHSDLNKHVLTLTRDDAADIKESILASLAKRQVSAIALPDTIKPDDFPKLGGVNMSNRDFSALKTKFQIERLMVLVRPVPSL